MKHAVLATIALAAFAGAAFAFAPADTIRMRQANYKQMGSAMHGLIEQVRSGSPSLPQIRSRSALILRYAPQVLQWFPRGTGPEAGIRTRAKAEIWSDRQGFRLAGGRLLVAARQMDAAARSGDIARIRAALPALQGACGGCHESYRGPAN
ncbi:MAG TPA: cytochrome c [Allosphingosinicella sp.]|nr:cytochrome c [Allosphingosinicella sp.]